MGTASGTLVLALATFASTRTANRAARIAERSLLVNLRPLLVHTRREDPAEMVPFPEGFKLKIGGGFGDIQRHQGAIYMALPVRNVGSGMAVVHGYFIEPGWMPPRRDEHPDPDDFRVQGRDLYVPPADTSFWQGALRDEDDRFRSDVEGALSGEIDGLSVLILYGDHEGGQRVISRFSMRRPSEDGKGWFSQSGRHWMIDGTDPREGDQRPLYGPDGPTN